MTREAEAIGEFREQFDDIVADLAGHDFARVAVARLLDDKLRRSMEAQISFLQGAPLNPSTTSLLALGYLLASAEQFDDAIGALQDIVYASKYGDERYTSQDEVCGGRIMIRDAGKCLSMFFETTKASLHLASAMPNQTLGRNTDGTPQEGHNYSFVFESLDTWFQHAQGARPIRLPDFEKTYDGALAALRATAENYMMVPMVPVSPDATEARSASPLKLVQ